MSQDYSTYIQDIAKTLGKLNKEAPDVMKAFSALGTAAGAAGSLEPKTKELIALAIAVSTRCVGCIGFHTQKLIKLGVSLEEFVETLSMAIYMGGGPSVMYAAEAMQAFEQFSE